MTSATSSRARRLRRLLLGAGGVAGLLLLWQLAVAAGLVDPFFVGSPAGALREGARLAEEGQIWTDAVVTLLTLGKGLGLALLVGVPLSVVLGRWAPGWTLIELPIVMLNATPAVALVPPIIMIVGIDVSMSAFP